MKKRFLFPAVIIVMAVSSALFACKKKRCGFGDNKGDCICTMEYDPVCGSNGKTYGNACAAACDGITSYTKGECNTP